MNSCQKSREPAFWADQVDHCRGSLYLLLLERSFCNKGKIIFIVRDELTLVFLEMEVTTMLFFLSWYAFCCPPTQKPVLMLFIAEFSIIFQGMAGTGGWPIEGHAINTDTEIIGTRKKPIRVDATWKWDPDFNFLVGIICWKLIN